MWRRVAARVHEFSECWSTTRRDGVGAAFPQTVTYHPSCHALRALGIRDQPRRLLQAVGGLTWSNLPRHDECCGFGGTFAIKNADVSTSMLQDKLTPWCRPAPSVCVAADNSCLMQIGGGLRRQNAGVRCLHLAESSPGPDPEAAEVIRIGHADSAAAFPDAARAALGNEQLRRNVRHATT
jgi:L-lactate dehydrogenase complex protein LldE